jgi:Biotin-lipoyl like
LQTDNQQNVLLGKLNALSAILRLGHEAFEKASLTELAIHIVNNTRLALPFTRSSLVDMSYGQAIILAQTAQIEVNPHSEYNSSTKTFLKNIKYEKESVIEIDNDFIKKQNNITQKAFQELNADNSTLYLVPLRPPRAQADSPDLMLWLIEFSPPPQAKPIPLLSLIGKHYAEALWSLHKIKNTFVSRAFKRKMTPGRVTLIILVIFIISLFAIRVHQNVAAEFSIRPEHEIVTFAWYDGIIKGCPVEDGAKVKKGDIILRYDTRQLQYRLAAAKAELNQADAEYEKVSSEAFTQKQQLGNIKLLQIKQKRAKIAIDECKWLLSKSILRAQQNGILSLTSGNSEKLRGKAVKLGEKLFEIFSGTDLQAEIEVPEKDASIIEQKPQITLYLHARPEVPLTATVEFTSSQPILTARNTFCYMLNSKLNKNNDVTLRYGMRGTARLSGQRVTLAYYLFRNLVLWWRNL